MKPRPSFCTKERRDAGAAAPLLLLLAATAREVKGLGARSALIRCEHVRLVRCNMLPSCVGWGAVGGEGAAPGSAPGRFLAGPRRVAALCLPALRDQAPARRAASQIKLGPM